MKRLKKSLRDIEAGNPGLSLEISTYSNGKLHHAHGTHGIHTNGDGDSSTGTGGTKPIQITLAHGLQGNSYAISQSSIILLCCKPQGLGPLLSDPEIQAQLHPSQLETPSQSYSEGSGGGGKKTIISICAGVRVEQIRGMVPEGVEVVRAMPNTPSKVSLGNFGVCNWAMDAVREEGGLRGKGEREDGRMELVLGMEYKLILETMHTPESGEVEGFHQRSCEIDAIRFQEREGRDIRKEKEDEISAKKGRTR